MRKSSKSILVVMLTILAFHTNTSFGYHTQITISNPLSSSCCDEFGWAVSIDGNNALVGSVFEDVGATDAGSAYLFDATTGALLRTFTNPTPASDDQFGYDVSISGNNVLVGTINDDTGASNTGSAYLFDATTGALLRTFTNPTPELNDNFGRSVSISGNYVLVGAPFDDPGFTNSGSAYLFDATTGALLRTFTNPTPASDDQFGYTISISGNYILIGARFDNTGATDAGSAYLFDATTGALLRTFNNPTPASGDEFGRDVSIYNNSILIGAFADDTDHIDSGSAYLFDATTGALLRTFNHPSLSYIGPVSIFGNNVLVGAGGEGVVFTTSTSAYLFDATTGALLRTFTNPTPQNDDEFGQALSISGNSIIIGAKGQDVNYGDTGIAYLYHEDIIPPLPPQDVDQAQGQVQILGTCGLSFPNGNAVNYGNLAPNTISPEVKLNMTNSGSVNATLTVKGGDWKDSGNNSVMLVNRTHYNVTSNTYFQKTSLQAFDQLVKNPFVPSVILQTFWQLQSILLNPSFTGSTTQTMDFTVSC